MDREAWHAAVHGVTKKLDTGERLDWTELNWTELKHLLNKKKSLPVWSLEEKRILKM